jgi:hypothetical protein
MCSPSSMSDREVWEKASTIAAAFGDDEPERFTERLFDILRNTTNPQDWRRVAAAVDVIAGASRQ